MWVLGHMGFGSRIARIAARGRVLPLGWTLLGTILPDLIDKPLYYGAMVATGRTGFDIGLISCTRTFGHTALFALGLAFVAAARRSKPVAAVALGVATHLVLDGFQDYWFHRVLGHVGESSAFVAALYPFFLPRFSEMPFATFSDHLRTLGRPFLLVSEAAGALILAWTWVSERRRMELSGRIGSSSRRSRAGR